MCRVAHILEAVVFFKKLNVLIAIFIAISLLMIYCHLFDVHVAYRSIYFSVNKCDVCIDKHNIVHVVYRNTCSVFKICLVYINIQCRLR